MHELKGLVPSLLDCHLFKQMEQMFKLGQQGVILNGSCHSLGMKPGQEPWHSENYPVALWFGLTGVEFKFSEQQTGRVGLQASLV